MGHQKWDKGCMFGIADALLISTPLDVLVAVLGGGELELSV